MPRTKCFFDKAECPSIPNIASQDGRDLCKICTLRKLARAVERLPKKLSKEAEKLMLKFYEPLEVVDYPLD